MKRIKCSVCGAACNEREGQNFYVSSAKFVLDDGGDFEDCDYESAGPIARTDIVTCYACEIEIHGLRKKLKARGGVS